MDLTQAVERFARHTHTFTEPELERPWAWRDYDSEGVRFAFFRVYEELRALAVALQAERAAGPALSQAQRILAQYHLAYRDLHAVLLGADDLIDQAPAEEEWPLRTVLRHIIGADLGFFVAVSFALDRSRSGAGPVAIPDEAWEEIIGHDEATFDSAMQAPLAEILAYYEALHRRVRDQFASITDAELAAPSIYWESAPFETRFRLHRFDSHLRQHTIQAEKTLVAIGHAPSEAARLLRLIYAALAECEGATIGAPAIGAGRQHEVAVTIASLTDVIATP